MTFRVGEWFVINFSKFSFFLVDKIDKFKSSTKHYFLRLNFSILQYFSKSLLYVITKDDFTGPTGLIKNTHTCIRGKGSNPSTAVSPLPFFILFLCGRMR